MALGSAPHVAAVVAAAERDGAPSHGLLRLDSYVSALRSGWVDGAAGHCQVDGFWPERAGWAKLAG